MDQYAESAAAFADSARAAIAFMRATRDGRDGDAELIAQGVSPYSLALQVANVACHQDLADEFLDLELELINRADADGQLERSARENNILLNHHPEKRERHEIPALLGETPAGLMVGTITECGTCKECGVCCQGEGLCIVITHPEDVVQHVTAGEAWALVTLLMIAARKTEACAGSCEQEQRR